MARIIFDYLTEVRSYRQDRYNIKSRESYKIRCKNRAGGQWQVGKLYYF